MRDRRVALIAGAALLVGAIGLAGCSPEPGQDADPSPSATATASADAGSTAVSTPSSSFSRTLSKAEQEAVDEATGVVLAYRQTGVDLLSGRRSNLNDLNALVAGTQLDADLKDLQHAIADGWRADGHGAVKIVWSSPSKVDLDQTPASIELLACVDLTSITFTQPNGEDVVGTRGAAGYDLERMSRNGEWKVTNVVVTPADQAC